MASVFPCSLKLREPFHFLPCSDLCWLIPKQWPLWGGRKRKGGVSRSLGAHRGRWLVLFPDLPLPCFPLYLQAKDLAKQVNSVHCGLPSSTGEGGHTEYMLLNPDGYSVSLKINFIKRKISESEKIVYEKVNKQFWFTNSWDCVPRENL